MINARDLMRIHVETLFTRDDAGRLLVVNEAGGAAAPRFFLGRTADGHAWWFRHDVAAAVANDLRALSESQPTGLEVEARLGSTAPFIARLARDAPVRRTWAGPAFRFPASLPGPGQAVRVTPDNVGVLSPYFEDWRDDVTAGPPCSWFWKAGRPLPCAAAFASHPWLTKPESRPIATSGAAGTRPEP